MFSQKKNSFVNRFKAPFFLLLSLFVSFSLAAAQSETAALSNRGTQAMVVTAHPEATQAALEILQAGGNAVDAAIAAQWVLNVAEPQSSGIGGGGFFVYYEAKTKRVYTFDGREKAPQRAHPKMFLDAAGRPIRFYPERITGGLAVGVPGTLKLLKLVHDRFGSSQFQFEALFEPAIALAEHGVRVSKRLAESIQEEAMRLLAFEAARKMFFHRDGPPLKEGEMLVQPDLARTFRAIQEQGIETFYQGEIAQALVDAIQKAPLQPGLLELSDLKGYEPVEREVLEGSYHGYQIFTMGPPSSGGVAFLEILNILENFELADYGPSADSFHLTLEAQKIAFEDRARFLGDPDAIEIPLKGFLSKGYAKEKALQIDVEKATKRETRVEEASLVAASNTSHISIKDPLGNIVSYTTTIEHIFGSGIVVPGWGFFLNNELTDFDPEPEGPNAPGPGKRPRSSMTPTIIFRDKKPFLVAGSPGGSLIIPTVQEVVTNIIDFQMPLEEALASPRFAARSSEAVEVEPAFLRQGEVVEGLKKRGHNLTERKPFGNIQAILFLGEQTELLGASDPRGEGKALGY